jgi:hypothetical protein
MTDFLRFRKIVHCNETFFYFQGILLLKVFFCNSVWSARFNFKIFDFFGFFPNFHDFRTFSSDFASILAKLAPQNHDLHKINSRYSALDTSVPSADD